MQFDSSITEHFYFGKILLAVSLDPDPHSSIVIVRLDPDPYPHIMNADTKHTAGNLV
jgi:hypothetical protein